MTSIVSFEGRMAIHQVLREEPIAEDVENQDTTSERLLNKLNVSDLTSEFRTGNSVADFFENLFATDGKVFRKHTRYNNIYVRTEDNTPQSDSEKAAAAFKVILMIILLPLTIIGLIFREVNRANEQMITARSFSQADELLDMGIGIARGNPVTVEVQEAPVLVSVEEDEKGVEAAALAAEMEEAFDDIHDDIVEMEENYEEEIDELTADVARLHEDVLEAEEKVQAVIAVNKASRARLDLSADEASETDSDEESEIEG